MNDHKIQHIAQAKATLSDVVVLINDALGILDDVSRRTWDSLDSETQRVLEEVQSGIRSDLTYARYFLSEHLIYDEPLDGSL